MIICGKGCYPCCDFCIHANQGTMVYNGKEITTGPQGCNLHKDDEHQNIAIECGYCDDFHCFKATEENKVKIDEDKFDWLQAGLMTKENKGEKT